MWVPIKWGPIKWGPTSGFMYQTLEQFFYVGLSSIFFISRLDSCYQTYVILTKDSYENTRRK